jgi:site-specific DNA recombinase
LLRGLLYSDTGRAFTPGWTVKGVKYYRYYVNLDSIKLDKTACEVRRLPAGEIEMVVIERLRDILRSPEVLAHAVREVRAARPDIDEGRAIEALRSIDAVWDELFPAEQAGIVKTLIERIIVRKDGLSITWTTAGMSRLLRDTLGSEPRAQAA